MSPALVIEQSSLITMRRDVLKWINYTYLPMHESLLKEQLLKYKFVKQLNLTHAQQEQQFEQNYKYSSYLLLAAPGVERSCFVILN